MKRLLAAAIAVAVGALFVSLASAQQPIEVPITDLGDSGISGTGTLEPSPDGSETTITIDATGLQPNASHINHVHEGVCENYGAVVVTLTELQADDNGDATATTSVTETDQGDPLTFADLTDGNHVLIIHDAEGVPAACGAIPQQEAVAATATPASEPTPAGVPAAGSGGFLDEGSSSAWPLALATGLAVLSAVALGLALALRRARS